ncbi:MAG: host attachment protein [Silvanigrellaceae bacterium]
MKQVAVLTVDHTKARFLILKSAERPGEQWSPVLSSVELFLNKHWQEQKNETLAGGHRFSYHVGFSGMAQTMHGYDDHLSRHQHEIVKRFSREISEKLLNFVSEFNVEAVVLAADRKVLGELRDSLPGELYRKLRVNDLDANLTKLSPVALHEHLSKLGLLPARNPPANPQREPYARSGQWRRKSAPSEGRVERGASEEIGEQ